MQRIEHTLLWYLVGSSSSLSFREVDTFAFLESAVPGTIFKSRCVWRPRNVFHVHFCLKRQSPIMLDDRAKYRTLLRAVYRGLGRSTLSEARGADLAAERLRTECFTATVFSPLVLQRADWCRVVNSH